MLAIDKLSTKLKLKPLPYGIGLFGLVFAMKKTVHKTKVTAKAARKGGITAGFVDGLASMLLISTQKKNSMRRQVESPRTALRGDFVRIGLDMRKAAAEVIEREETASQ